jgi:hypothetical protein
LRQLGPDIQWVESYVAADKTFCVYLAKDEDVIKEHAKLSGFPATKITEVRKMIDPTTEHAAYQHQRVRRVAGDEGAIDCNHRRTTAATPRDRDLVGLRNAGLGTACLSKSPKN